MFLKFFGKAQDRSMLPVKDREYQFPNGAIPRSSVELVCGALHTFGALNPASETESRIGDRLSHKPLDFGGE